MARDHRASAQSGASGAAHGRRRGRARARIAGATTVSLLLLLVAGAGWVYLRLNGNISTFGTDGLSHDRPGAGAGGQNILVMGSDSRSGGNSRLGGGRGDVGRSDTAFLLHVYGDRRHAVAVSFPRDALVDIPPCKLPHGGWTRPQHDAMFNSAFTVGDTAKGNPACTQNTVEKLTGLRVDHTVVVDFEGFAKMTSAVGGVPVCLPNDIYQGDVDPHRGSRGTRIFHKGQQTVTGQRALDYVRLRHGVGDGSDIGRIRRQQAFVSSLVKKIKDKGFGPSTLLPLANAVTESMTVDEGLGTTDKMMSFAMSLKNVDLHNTKFVTLPWRYQGARVAVVEPRARALFADLRADRTLDGKDAAGKPGAHRSASPSPEATVSGAGTRVAVYNGTTVTGLAADAAGTLTKHGFTVTGTRTAASPGLRTTRIDYGPGAKDGAEKAARLFPGAQLRPGGAPGVTVTVGQDYADAHSPGGSQSGGSQSGGSGSGGGEKARSADDDLCSGLS